MTHRKAVQSPYPVIRFLGGCWLLADTLHRMPRAAQYLAGFLLILAGFLAVHFWYLTVPAIALWFCWRNQWVFWWARDRVRARRGIDNEGNPAPLNDLPEDY